MIEYEDVTDCPICPHLATDRDDALGEVASLQSEVDRLRQWQAEATAVINGWEAVWLAAGQPGPLGGSMSRNVAAEVERLRANQRTAEDAAVLDEAELAVRNADEDDERLSHIEDRAWGLRRMDVMELARLVRARRVEEPPGD